MPNLTTLNELTTCNRCGENLVFRKNADIVYKKYKGKLVPSLENKSVQFFDSCSLECIYCYIDDQNNSEIKDKLNQLCKKGLINNEAPN